ncbi:putative oxygen-independent coproporphyrinogen III oxidase [Xenococcus sp. PCC 7305]|uniref:radical SAM family heme chaperone HemW n=1 Tax=Xenococcus sp. PCC 7305 TaxID=102125 RepID=UPI0002AC9377|nr:radical SAM family heme chaperone HemW [Xenococcus sp. PCC 7305]ELS01699.1 putative oxygen-independent coproporphyrinogen III oxidase [Xenococcus sp. PCC 7305]
MSQKSPLAAYIHIPFCRRRCYYCDFAITVTGDRPLSDNSTMVGDYVNYLQQEIRATSPTNSSLQTIFFGGGTPSVLPVAKLGEILTTIDRYLGIAPNAEISMEIDPGTFNRQQLQEYLNLGVNRFSLGVQTFDEQLLKICGRSHNRQDIFAAIEAIKELNVDNWSLDLITGLPHQTLQQVESSLETAIAIAPKHLSCYDLVLEPVTAFGKQFRPGEQPLPTEENSAAMYGLTQQMLTDNGYQHYEISNYAQPGYQCRHNRVYWQNQSYYGFGMSAASYVDFQRYTRPRTRKDYYSWVEAGSVIDVAATTKCDLLLETLMLGLRLAEGVNLSRIGKEFGEGTIARILSSLQSYLEQNLVEISTVNHEQRLRLVDPQGFLLSNTIITSLFETFDDDS